MMNINRNPVFFWLVPILALLLAFFACIFPLLVSPSTTPLPASPTPIAGTAIFLPTFTPLSSESPLPIYQPILEAAPCAFPAPAGYNPECGYLIVPENRANPNSALIKLHVAIFHSTAEGPDPTPLVHLAGGPGSSSLDTVGYLFGQGLNAVLNRRDFIFFDQRGTGYSQPRLDCPERNEIAANLLDGSLSEADKLQAIVAALKQCRERLTAQGIDLSTYNSAASAADLNDLRQALGYEQLDLYGVSYGTRLALTVMRNFPQAVHSIVLDSTYPLEVNLYTALAPNAERAFNVLFDNCAADPTCNAAYPDLRTVFYTLVDQLNANPRLLSLSWGGTSYTVALDGDLLVDVLFVGLYNPAVTATMPKMIYQMQQGDDTILRERLGLYFGSGGGEAMTLSVQCREEIPFNVADDAYRAAQGVQPQIAAFFPQSVQYLFAACSDWTSAAPDPRENQPVSSDIPTLILAGEFDPITPPSWGQTTAGHLGHAYFYEFRGNGHWVTRSSPCALSIMLAFLDDPQVAPDATCIQSLPAMQFAP